MRISDLGGKKVTPLPKDLPCLGADDHSCLQGEAADRTGHGGQSRRGSRASSPDRPCHPRPAGSHQPRRASPFPGSAPRRELRAVRPGRLTLRRCPAGQPERRRRPEPRSVRAGFRQVRRQAGGTPPGSAPPSTGAHRSPQPPAGPTPLRRTPSPAAGQTVTAQRAGPDGARAQRRAEGRRPSGLAVRARRPGGYLRAPLAPPLLQLVRGVVPAVSHFASLGDPQGWKGGEERSEPEAARRGRAGCRRGGSAGEVTPWGAAAALRRALKHQQVAGAAAPQLLPQRRAHPPLPPRPIALRPAGSVNSEWLRGTSIRRCEGAPAADRRLSRWGAVAGGHGAAAFPCYPSLCV